MTPEEIKDHAEDIILGARDNIEFGSVVEILADSGEVPDADLDKVADAVHDAIRAATVTVTWPDA